LLDSHGPGDPKQLQPNAPMGPRESRCMRAAVRGRAPRSAENREIAHETRLRFRWHRLQRLTGASTRTIQRNDYRVGSEVVAIRNAPRSEA
jgi:hypothetical protein